MALPKEPRQKMINLMYLVLTALLALNVSSEILNAFKTVNNSLLTANGVIDNKNAAVLKSLDAQLKDPKTEERARVWQPLAKKAQTMSDDVIKYIDDLKTEIMKASGLEADGKYKEDDLEGPTRVLIEQKKAKVLQDKLAAYKDALLNIDPKIKAEFANSLPIDLSIPKSQTGAKNTDWGVAYFHMTPSVAAITILSKFQNDIKNSESKVIEFCQKQVGAVEFVIDSYQAFAGTNSQYLMPGQELVITAGVGAFSKAAVPTITVDGANVSLNENGAAEYKTTVGGPGSYSKKVKISFINQSTGKPDVKEVDVKYTVGSPTGIQVSPDAVKVLYIGLDNPISISGGSKGAEAISASMTNGSLQNQGNGKYVARPESPGKATINVTVDGKTTPFEFRVKRVPDPTPMVGQFGGGSVPANAFKSQQGVRADLKDFVFEGVTYSVTKFTIVCTGKGFESSGAQYDVVSGPYFSAKAKAAIEQCRPGSSVNITEIHVTGPDGPRKLNASMAFNLTN